MPRGSVICGRILKMHIHNWCFKIEMHINSNIFPFSPRTKTSVSDTVKLDF